VLGIAACVLVVWTTAACGSREAGNDGRGGEARVNIGPGNRHSSSPGQKAHWPLVIYEESGGGPANLAHALSMLGEPRGKTDELPEGVKSELRRIAEASARLPADSRPGDLRVEESRLALAARYRGARGLRLFAVPTANNWVCHVLLAGGRLVSSGCDARMRQGITMNLDQLAPRGPLMLFGFVEDNVIGVRLRVGGEIHEAQLGANAFLALIAAGAEEHAPEEVILQLKTGLERTVKLRG
jgi:hypothetical protein